MNKKIEKLLEDYCKEIGIEKWKSEEELWHLLLEFDVIHEKLISEHRWWNIYRCVIKVKDIYIGYIGAKTTGDNNAYETGWEFDSSTICEMKPIEKTIVTYIKK